MFLPFTGGTKKFQSGCLGQKKITAGYAGLLKSPIHMGLPSQNPMPTNEILGRAPALHRA